MKLNPTEDAIVVVPVYETQTKGGIIIPDRAKRSDFLAKVISIGPGKWNPANQTRDPMPCQVGATVVCGAYSGTEVSVDGTDYKIVSAEDILATVTD